MSKRRIGYYLRDKSSQTEESEILDLKRVTTAMQALTQVHNQAVADPLTNIII